MNNKGFSLVELVVAMAIFMVLMIAISTSYNNIYNKTGQQVKSAETNTEGIVGLEMLRADLEHTGYGLLWSFSISPATFPEVDSSANPVTGITSAATFNYDKTKDLAPKPIQVGLTPTGKKIIDGSGNTNPEVAYLVINSTMAAMHATARKWAYVNYTDTAGTNTSSVSKWNAAADDFVNQERVITISTSFSTTGEPARQLMMASASEFSYPMPGAPPVEPPDNVYKPGDASQSFLVYGVDPDHNLRMPWNRADYYLKKPASGLPSSCNPGTGVLYKGVVRQADGTFLEYPLLNCVGDMQVEFELDPNADGNITYTPTLTGRKAHEIRAQLKNIRVYILAQEGKKDRGYSYGKDSIQVGDPLRPGSSGRTWNDALMQSVFGGDWKNYRWKVYTIVVTPKNLN